MYLRVGWTPHSAGIKYSDAWRGPIYMSLNELVRRHYNFRATDPRDRIFGLLGPLPKEERSILDHFFPDYDMSYEKVMLITIAFLNQQFSLLPIVSAKRTYSARILTLDQGLWERLWAKVEEYQTPGSLPTFSRTQNVQKLWKLQRQAAAGSLSKDKMVELERRSEYDAWVDERIRVLRVLARSS